MFEPLRLTVEQWIDHEAGFEAGCIGLPCDNTKSNDWQRGWAEAQQ